MKTIQKICHLYWDLSPMALLQTYTITTFHKLNPDWKIIVYVIKQSYKELGDNTFVPNYTGEDYFYKVRDMDFVEIREIDVIERGIGADKHSILGSDIFRMQALYETGGVYCDFDVIWIKPMDHFSNVDHIGNIDNFESIVSFYEYTKGHHNISILMSAPGSSYIKSIIEEQKKTMPPYQHQSFGTFMLNNLYPDLNSITTKYPKVLAVKYLSL